MVVLSVLGAAKTSCKVLANTSLRSIASSIKNGQRQEALQLIRRMGSERTMQPTPSRFEYNRFKDHLHFYVLLGVIPLTIATTYINLTYGESQLVDIPEDYEPKYWEYQKHPVSRFFARTFMQNPQQSYEMRLHHLKTEEDSLKHRAMEIKVKELIKERGDYRSWYYLPYSADGVYRGRQEEETLSETNATR